MQVAFDISALDPNFKSHSHRGIGRYVDRLQNSLGLLKSDELSVSWFNHHQLLSGGIMPKIIGTLPFGRTTIRQQALYPLRLAGMALRDVDFVHFPAHMDGPAWSAKPYVLTLLDLIPLILKDLYRAHRPNWRYNFARWLENTSIVNASYILTISETTAIDAERILGIPRERIAVTACGVDECFTNNFASRNIGHAERGKRLREKLGLPPKRPILLYVGGHDERKNTPRIVEIGREVLDSCGSMNVEPPILVFAGKISDGREKESITTALRNFAMAADTFLLGFVSDEDLLDLYSEAAVFLFPSLYEGFGLPPLEAMATGLPVVSSNRGALPEVLGEAALFIDPEDVIQGARRVLSILSDSAMASNLSTAGFERAKLFSWNRTAATTLAAYKEVQRVLTTKNEPRRISQVIKKHRAKKGSEDAPCCVGLDL